MERINNVGELKTVRTDLIDPSKKAQPREYFDPKYIDDLGESILEIGLKDPVHIIDLENGRYELQDGECRLRAHLLKGIKQIRSIVHKQMPSNVQFLNALTLNFFGKRHTHREVFKSLSRLTEEGYSVQQIMRVLGKSDAWVYGYLSLRKLAPELQELVEHDPKAKEVLRIEEAKQLARIEDHNVQRKIFADVKDLPPNRRKTLIVKRCKNVIPPKPRKNRTTNRDFTDDKRMVLSFIDMVSAKSESVMEVNNKSLQRILSELSGSEKEMWLQTINDAVVSLEIFMEIIAGTMPAKPQEAELRN